MSSSQPVGRPQPTPRMTDSTSGPNGPQSLAFASLSVQSYHLDSPPFTGTSMGSYGPLAQEGERLAQKEKEMEKQRMNHNQSSNPSTPARGRKNGKKEKASSPLSRAVKVGEMSRIVDHQDQSQAGQGDSSRQIGLNRDQVAEGDNGSKPSSSNDAHNGSADQFQIQSNQGSKDRDVPKWQLDGTTSSTSSSSHSLSSSQSQSQPSSTLPSNDSSTDSKLTSTPIPNSVSRGAPPFSSNGSGESSGISTPISTFKSSSSNSNSNNSSSKSLPQSSTRQKAYSGGAHSSMESNSHSHAGSTSPPIIDHQQTSLTSTSSQRSSSFNSNSNGNQRKDRWREDSNSSRPSYTQLASQDSSSEHEGDEGEIDRHLPPPLDEEVDGDDTAFVIQHGQNNGGGGGGIGGVATGVGASNSNTVGFGKGVPVQGSTKEEYRFPRHRLPTRMRDESKTPLVIVACGSFSPPTYLHLRIFEMAKDQIIESGKYELLGGYYSPVSDYYKKEGLAPARHRVRMCELAVEKTSTWLMVDAWESLQDEYQRTAVVLDHFDDEINGPRLAKTSSRPNTAVNGSTATATSSSSSSASSGEGKERGGVLLSDGSRKRIKIMLLAGGDLIQSMGEPGIWASADLHHILGRYGCLIVERTGADVWSFLLSHDLLWKYRRNLKIVKQTIYNDISSSKVRLFVRRGQSIKYLLPNSVIHYIEKHKLYRLPPAEEHDEATLDDENW